MVTDVSLDLLNGSEVDFVEDLIGASFQVRNPNATSSCGCGSSFAVWPVKIASWMGSDRASWTICLG